MFTNLKKRFVFMTISILVHFLGVLFFSRCFENPKKEKKNNQKIENLKERDKENEITDDLIDLLDSNKFPVGD